MIYGESTLRFVAAFWLCILLIEDSLAFCLGQTLPVSKLGCVLCQDFVAFCLEDFLCFVLRPLRFVSRLGCILSQDLLCFDSRLTVFCLQSVAFCLQASCVLSEFEDLFLSFGRRKLWTDFSLWQQRIRLYCRGKENGVNILKSIDEGPYQMRTVREPLAEITKGAPQFAIKLNRGLRDSNYDQLYAYLKQHETHAKENKMMLERFSQHTWDPPDLMSNVSNPQLHSPSSSTSSSIQVPQHLADNPHLDSSQGMNPRGGGAARYGGAQNRVGNVNRGQARPAQENGVALEAEQLLFLAGGQDNAFDDDVDEQPVQDLALNVDNVFQADDCDAFDSDVDEAPTVQTMFMANQSSADPVTDEDGPSYDSDILSEIQDHDHYQDAVCAHHEEHTMHDSSRDRPPMLAPGRYLQWHSRFLRFVDTRPNGEALRKCILSGPYKPTTMLVHVVEATDDSLAVPEHTTVEMPKNMFPKNKAHFLAEKEAIHLILTGIGD
nr:hypothetical protein [Tanacetum cinerariifolium]